ncbi:tetratricopeptide repeat-containing sensor histidine kinase [Ekhidna sp.]
MKHLIILLIISSNFCFAQTVVLESKIDQAQQLADSGQYESTISLLHEILPNAQSQNSEYLIRIYMLLAKSHSYTGILDYGLRYYKLALEEANENNQLKTQGQSLLGIGSVYFAMDSVIKAKTYFEQSLPILEELKDTLNLAYINSNIALFNSDMGNHEEANKKFTKAILYFKLLEDWHGIASTNYNMGINESRRGDLNKAIDQFQKCYDISQKHSLIEDGAKAIRRIAIEYFKQENYEKASLYFLKFDTLGHDVFHQDSKEIILEFETEFKTAKLERDSARKQTKIQFLYFVSGFILLISLSGYFILDQRRRRIKSSSNQKINDLLQQQETQTTHALLEGQDKERKRVAAELHDSLGSILVTLNMYADTLITKDSKEMKSIALKISETAQLANEETRKISHSLDSGMLKHFGLEAAINQLSEAVSTAKQIKFDSSIQLQSALSTDMSLEIYRVIQELVNNSLKHSQCSRIRLELTSIKDSLNLIYEDNGVGFKKEEVIRGMGLKNIENRVDKLNGELTIDSSPNHGSTCIIEIFSS